MNPRLVIPALGVACGGQLEGETLPDATLDRQADTPSRDVTADTAADANTEVGCEGGPPIVYSNCISGCPDGSVCIWFAGPTPYPGGCAPIASACNGKPTCDCMGCVCPPYRWCDYRAGQDIITCDNGGISRRDAKTDIAYVDPSTRTALARDALDVRLATYRYRADPTGRRHLGFIIDDQPDDSPAVQEDRTHVDLYGYASMLLAAVQEQQRTIERLEARVGRLERMVAVNADQGSDHRGS